MTTTTPKFQKTKLNSALHRQIKKTKVKQKKVLTLVWLQYLLAMQKLAIEAQNKAKEEKKNIIHNDHIRAVSKKVLQSCKG
ncbi:Hypothetical predicted protein [Mytilus galloprovincialis]|uniref:Centromere protein W n=1 Tax=Mytilus galloprovincialis TaxID=29158 RepID=A0A8B6F126_MYTGA|nr:Hypothetical predicted protein [Mytilus galloprovincialis]